jgi:NAD(P)-dependent dehydrogenase (short-subunit alcohol dehydrogenase family)
MNTALITGTSSGIGLETAVLLAQHGYKVVATMRNLEKRAALEARASELGVTLELLELDAQNDASVSSAVNTILERFGRIDALVNNAGAGHLGSLEQVSLEDAQRVMDQNFWSAWRVTQAVMPHMRAARGGRIISVSSVGGIMGQPFNDAYCAAKFALEGMMECLAPVAARFGVHVSLVEPGPVHTAFLENVGGREHIGAAGDYAPLVAAYVGVIQKNFSHMGQSAGDIASVILNVLQAEQPHLRYQTGDTVRARVAAKLSDTTGETALRAGAMMLGA